MTTNQTTTTRNTTAAPAELQQPAMPVNAVTGRAYFGDKGKRLLDQAKANGYATDVWATMKQWNNVKETIARGEKGTLLIHTDTMPDGTEVQKRSFVFNRCQLESWQDVNDKAF